VELACALEPAASVGCAGSLGQRFQGWPPGSANRTRAEASGGSGRGCLSLARAALLGKGRWLT
jgi:hypothetical protein